jgi:hypothetical protein
MDRVVRKRLDMAVRVREFSRAHPSADANYAPVLGRLEDRVNRLETLAKQQQGGFMVKRSSVVKRRGLRRRLRGELLRHLVTVAEVAAQESPGIVQRYRLPASNASSAAFQALARKLLENGQTDKELLARHGLSATLLDDLAKALGEYDASVEESSLGRRDHVAARAELNAVSREVLDLVELLDGLNRYRFGSGSATLAAWQSAKNVVSGPRSAEPGDEPGPAPAPGEVKPAA